MEESKTKGGALDAHINLEAVKISRVPKAIGCVDIFFRCMWATVLWENRGLFKAILVLVVFPTLVLQRILEMAAAALVTESDDCYWIAHSTALLLAQRLLDSLLSPLRYIIIVYAVATILEGKAVVLKGLAEAVRRLWGPTTLTSLVFFAFEFGMMVLADSLQYTTCPPRGRICTVWPIVYMPVLAFLVLIARGACQLMLVVAVVEEVYGLRALAKSWNLFKHTEGIIRSPSTIFTVAFVTSGVGRRIYPKILARSGELVYSGLTVNALTSLTWIIEAMAGIAVKSLKWLFIITILTLMYYSGMAKIRARALQSRPESRESDLSPVQTEAGKGELKACKLESQHLPVKNAEGYQPACAAGDA